MVNVRINSRVRRVGVDKELDKCDVGGVRALFVGFLMLTNTWAVTRYLR